MSLDLEALERVHAAYVDALKRACDVGDSEAAFAEQAVAAIPTLIARARAAERMEKQLEKSARSYHHEVHTLRYLNQADFLECASPVCVEARAALAKEKA